MDPLMQLALMWLSAQPGGGAPAARAPAWPTPASPPPMPAFTPKKTPTPPRGADTGTPLTALHAASKAKPKPKAAPKRASVPKITPGVLKSTVTVARLQQALNARGAKLKPDGLFGPKTAAAWSKFASAKSLPGLISRKGPKTAEVVTHTLDALSFPPIP